MKDVKNRYIVVAGGARSGIAAALLLKKTGADVFLSDAGSIAPDMEQKLIREQVSYEKEGHTERAAKGEILVISPGIPSTSPIAIEYMEAGKMIYSEVEIASWFTQNRMVAVTGTNGKTTVVNWLDHIWKMAGKPHQSAGNIGKAFSEAVLETDNDADFLLEISSFQLDHIDRFHPKVSLILNITPDHLDRYQQDFERYAASKFRITENQTSGDWFIFDADDPILDKFSNTLSPNKNSPALLAYSLEKKVEQGMYIHDDQIILSVNQKTEPFMKLNDIGLPGRHNLKNGMAAALAARACELSNDIIRESLRSFEGVEHRLELVRTLNGVRYINDSKATNINAVWVALDSYDVPLVLILGGRDKGNNYKNLESQLRENVHTVVAIGEARRKIRNQLQGVVPNLLEADTLKEAVKISQKKAKRGEVVLLSPA